MLARSLNAQVTSPRARRRGQINLDVLRDVIPVVQRTVAMNSIYEQRLAVIFPTGIPDHLDLITKLIRFFCKFDVLAGLFRTVQSPLRLMPSTSFLRQIQPYPLWLSTNSRLPCSMKPRRQHPGNA